MIEFKQVNKHFGSLHVLQDINLTVKEGEVTVICGPSGSGKSTLIRTINQLEAISAGDIWVDGKSIFDPSRSLNTLRKEIGFVFQQFNLYPHLSVLENITLAPRKLNNLSATAAETKALELLEQVGLSDKRHQYPAQLSGGQQQRVAIARALAMEPRVLLFDEPTSALDPEMINEVLDVMVELAQEGMTMMVVTHEMGFAHKVANRVIFMDHGQIVEDAAKEEFFGAPRSERAQQFLSKILHHCE